MKTILTNCSLIDCTGKDLQKDMTLVIQDNRIEDIYPGIYQDTQGEIPGIRVIDLKGGYVLPGLWNVHGHLGDLLPDIHNLLPNEPVGNALIRAGRNAMEGLRAGVTSMRIVGERDCIDFAWKQAFDSGVMLGPRLFVCGVPITATGGHSWEPVGPGGIEIDGPFEMRKAVRENIKRGADQIKIMDSELQEDEIQAAVETAHSRGIKVAVHSRAPMTKVSIRCGVDTIEHAYKLDDETIMLMKDYNVFYVPTLICNLDEDLIRSVEKKMKELFPEEDQAKKEGRLKILWEDVRTKEHCKTQRDGFKKAVDAGIKVCTGGDSVPNGELELLEIEQFVLAGMTEMQAIIAATRWGAEICGVEDQLGTLEKGKLADLLILEDNPLESIYNLRKVKTVFKDGFKIDPHLQEGLKDFWELYFVE